MTAPVAGLTVEEARAELDALDDRIKTLRPELAAAEIRANELRQFVGSALLAQAQALLSQVKRKDGSALTRRELEFARAYAVSTVPLADLARRHNVSLNTAKTHIKNIYRKLGVDRRRDLLDVLRRAEHLTDGPQARAAA